MPKQADLFCDLLLEPIISRHTNPQIQRQVACGTIGPLKINRLTFRNMIIFFHLLNDNSGSPVVLRETIRALSDSSNDNILFVGSQGRGCLEDAGVPIKRYWYRRSRWRIVTLFTFFLSQIFLYRALSRAKLPQDAIVYVNTLLPFGAALWAHWNSRRVVYHIHETSISPAPFRHFLVAIVEKTAIHAFYVSEDHKSRMPIRGVPTAVIPNFVEPGIAAAGLASPYTPRDAGMFNVLMLASPRDFKGIPEFLKLARSLSVRTDIRFTLVLNADATEIARYLPDDQRPQNLAVFPRTNTPSYFYAQASVIVNLARTDQWIETFGLTLIEGMAFGLPAIAPPVGGPVEIITHGQNGYLIDSRDHAALYEHIILLADTPELTQKMSIAARHRAADFTKDRFTRALQDQINALTTGTSNAKILK